MVYESDLANLMASTKPNTMHAREERNHPLGGELLAGGSSPVLRALFCQSNQRELLQHQNIL